MTVSDDNLEVELNPSATGEILAKTTGSNATADSYTLSFATKVDTDDDGTADGAVKYEMFYRGGKVVGGTSGIKAITDLAKTSDSTEGHVVEYDVAGDQAAGFLDAWGSSLALSKY